VIKDEDAIAVDTPPAAGPLPGDRNRFDRMEWAGAFGDLGTLIPFVLAYVSVMGLDPLGVLLRFGVCMIASGLWYRTPFPVQPMKALGVVATTQAAQTAFITPQAVYGSGLVTGLLWLLLGLTGATRWVAHLVSRPVVTGIVLGLGLGFMVEGVRQMASGWLLSVATLVVALLLLSSRRVPAMFVMLIGGGVVPVLRDPSLLQSLGTIRFAPRAPSFALADITWSDFVIGTVFFALPQVPLTLGNAMIAIVEENNKLFPHRRVYERSVSISTGLMNVLGSSIGGVPMCHGAGGMAGHVRFGARTGGALERSTIAAAVKKRAECAPCGARHSSIQLHLVQDSHVVAEPHEARHLAVEIAVCPVRIHRLGDEVFAERTGNWSGGVIGSFVTRADCFPVLVVVPVVFRIGFE
jgi:hypothetical protein